MDKVTNFLERHVQWLALALAALFVLWNVYSYVITPPLTVKLNGIAGAPPVLTPGDVDPTILRLVVDPLKKAIEDPSVNPPRVANIQKEFDEQTAEKSVTIVTLNTPWASAHGQLEDTGPDLEQGIEQVAKLPVLPPAMPVAKAITARRTVIMVNGDAGQTRRDVNYDSAIFKIDNAALAKAGNDAFSKKGIPPGLFQVVFAQVELLREEQQADKSWSKPTVIKTLPIYEIPPYPSASASEADWFQYRDWINANQELIVRPAFYPTAPDAEGWVPPGAEAVDAPPLAGQPVVADRPFDPTRDIPRTDEQRKAVQEFRRQQEMQRKMAAQARRGMGGGGLPPGAMGMPGGYPGMPGGMNPYDLMGRRPLAPPAVNPTRPMYNPFPQAPNNNGNNPNLATTDPQLLVHDATIQEGRSYRYAVRYKLYNPLYKNAGNFGTKEVTNQFAIESPDPANPAVEKQFPGIWTDKIGIEPSTHVYVTNISQWNSQAQFDFFIWENGRWHPYTSAKLSPGDLVSKDKSSTPWSVVDVRKDFKSNQAYVILMDNRGVLLRRDVDSDKTDEQYVKLKAQTSAAAMAP